MNFIFTPIHHKNLELLYKLCCLPYSKELAFLCDILGCLFFYCKNRKELFLANTLESIIFCLTCRILLSCTLSFLILNLVNRSYDSTGTPNIV